MDLVDLRAEEFVVCDTEADGPEDAEWAEPINRNLKPCRAEVYNPGPPGLVLQAWSSRSGSPGQVFQARCPACSLSLLHT